MAATLSPVPKLQFFDANGAPLAGGKLYSYFAGTTTPQSTYTDSTGTTSNPNPVILDARGEAGVWLANNAFYKLSLYTSTDVLVWTVDQIASNTTLATLAASGGSALVGYLPAGTGAVATTVQTKLRETVSAFDFMTAAQIADVQAGALTLDVTVALQAALDASKNKRLYIPAGRYKTTATLNIDYTASYWVFGDGYAINSNSGTQIYPTANAPVISINNPGTFNYNPDIRLEHFGIYATNAGTAQKGIFVRWTNVVIDSVYVAGCGGHGIHFQKAFSSSIYNCVVAQNFLHGLWLDTQCNQILVSHSAFNGNAKTAGGYSGIQCAGGSGTENLGVIFLSCDTEGNGVVSGDGFGVTGKYTQGLTIQSHYSEGNKTGHYFDNSVKNLVINGSYFQDETVQIVESDGISYTNNRHFYNTIATSAVISAKPSSPCLISGNTYSASVTTSYTNGAKQIVEQYSTAPPATGTWANGDIIYHSTPYSGGNLGWICTTAGTPGTWKAFGTIA